MPLRSAPILSCLALCLVLAACAVPQGQSAPESSVSGGTPGGATAASSTSSGPFSPGADAPTAQRPAAPPAGLKPFGEIVKDAQRIDGYIPLWRKDDKVWFEIDPDRMDEPFFFSWNVSQGLGERGIYASSMGDRQLARFRRIGNIMQLVAINADFRATAGSPMERVVRQSFTDSLMAFAPVVSLPHPQRKSILVDANVLLLSDVPGYATRLETSFRIPYQFDRPNSSFGAIRSDARLTTLNVSALFSINRMPAPPPQKEDGSRPPNPAKPPENVPDARSFFIGFLYNFAPLPAMPMTPRIADERLGHFVTTISDFSDDLSFTPKLRFVNRWRLEKKDPAAALSEPKQPIVFWIDRNVPQDYRQTVIEGILEWNKAFERIGFRNAIVARIQPDDADWDTLDARHASVRWFAGVDAGFAIGPSHTDPRTGEILDADVAISDAFTRNSRTFISEAAPDPKPHGSLHGHDESLCDYAHEATAELGFALALLDARGAIDPDSPQADVFVKSYLKSIVMHEVGHALGLRHNFRASTIRSEQQLQNEVFTRTHGLTGSVMDYIPYNIATQGERQGEYVMSGLGPYDYWAIEYAYRPLNPLAEKEELARIAARNTEPELTFATDEDAGSGPEAMDPEVNRFDLGTDPLAYYRKRIALSRELWDRLATRTMKPDENYLILRRNFERGFKAIENSAPIVAKYIGGLHTTRDRAGSGRPLFAPVDAARQKQALDLIASSLFSIDSFRFDPAFMSRLGFDAYERDGKRDFNLAEQLLAIQSRVLDLVLSEAVAKRIMEAENKSNRPQDLLSLAQLYDTLQDAIWKELKSGTDISRARRNLQREHLKRVTAILVDPPPGVLADARSLQRQNAIALKNAIENRLVRRDAILSREARAHLQESIAAIDDALEARLIKK